MEGIDSLASYQLRLLLLLHNIVAKSVVVGHLLATLLHIQVDLPLQDWGLRMLLWARLKAQELLLILVLLIKRFETFCIRSMNRIGLPSGALD